MPSDADFMRWWRDFKSDPGFKKPMDEIRRSVRERQIESINRDLDKDVRDWRTRPSQAEFGMERDLDKDVRDYVSRSGRNRPSVKDFIEPFPRGGPSSYLRSLGKLGEMLYEIMGIVGPAKTSLLSPFTRFMRGGKRMDRLKGRGKESDKIDPTEYGKWSDEVSKNAPDPTPEDLMGHTRPEKRRILGKRWFDRGR